MSTFSLNHIARALRGRNHGRYVTAPGPAHSPRDNSLTVWLSSTSLDGFTVHSNAGDDWRGCRDYVADALGLNSDRRRRTVGARAEHQIRARAAAERQDRADEDARRRRAIALWEAGQDPRGSLADLYLKSRGLGLEDDVAGSAIRFTERCPWRDEEIGETVFVPAMLACMRDVWSGEVKAVHRTRLDASARKTARRMFGPVGNAAVMLDGFETISTGIVLGEGIESTMAGRQFGLRPAWAMGAVGGIARFPLLSGIEALTLLAENDENGASERACRTVGSLWRAAGRDVDIIRPDHGKDLNDELVLGGGVA